MKNKIKINWHHVNFSPGNKFDSPTLFLTAVEKSEIFRAVKYWKFLTVWQGLQTR